MDFPWKANHSLAPEPMQQAIAHLLAQVAKGRGRGGDPVREG